MDQYRLIIIREFCIHHTLGLCHELTACFLPNCEQRTLTRDDKCQGSTHTPYKTKRWEQSLQSVQKMVTHWCPDTHVHVQVCDKN